ncbi:DUF4153 domain-containing protein [Litchfieldia alkalitelluris]|uniref:DUF4153 domain-containing protein n=1 Tax=Litchfieldia alkalitelluris TaxID=304268 RepID=UPI000997D2A8|nr:DUF4173 domain-containing protein [Litchfieldia alkalitelluris]
MKIITNYPFVLCCLVLALAAEICLLSEPVGISYLVFISAFYMFFFYWFRNVSFSHKRISGLIFVSIYLLTITFFTYSNEFFNSINFVLIPVLVFIHIVLLTSFHHIKWNSVSFLILLQKKVSQLFSCIKITFRFTGRKLKRNIGESTYKTSKKIVLGIILSIPILLVVTFLLLIADARFASLLFLIPNRLLHFDLSFVPRFIRVLLIALGLYGLFKIISKKTLVIENNKTHKRNWDTIILTTVLIFLNLIYLLFTVVQFQYFFNGSLEVGFSYSEYARRGFFELMIVTLINYAILMGTITFVKRHELTIVKLMLTLLIFFSGVMLTSAFFRLMMYEQAYGFTASRLLAHSFMIYLVVVFGFTLIKVWANKLTLSHFYLIFTLIFYLGLNLISLDQLIVTKNIERFEETGKIDIKYLSTLSYSVVPDLVELHKNHPEIPGLDMILNEKRINLLQVNSWQSYNLSKQAALKAINKLE